MAEYLVRHGLTDWNIDHKIQGSKDIELNEKGLRQAKEMADKLVAYHFAVIYSSPLKRAYQTAEIIASAHPSTPLLIAPELAERNFGTLEGEPNSPDGNYYGVWDYNLSVNTGGESLADLEARVYPFLDRIRKEFAEKDVLLVAHGGIGLIIRQYYKGKPQNGNLLEFPPVANGSIEVLEKNN